MDKATPTEHLTYQVTKTPLYPGEADRATALAIDKAGLTHLAIFVGPCAMERANEYMAWKNGQK